MHNLNVTLYVFSEDLFTNEECKPKGSKCDLVQIFHISSFHLPEQHYSSPSFSLRDGQRHEREDVNLSPSYNHLNLTSRILKSHDQGL